MENYSREDSLQNANICLPDCFLYMEVVVYLYGKTDFVNTLRDCANGCNVTLGHNMFFQ